MGPHGLSHSVRNSFHCEEPVDYSRESLLWEATTLLSISLLLSPRHLLHSSGGSHPLVCHVELSVQSVCRLFRLLPQMTLSSPASFWFSLISVPSGGPRRPFNSPEKVDILPQDQADLFSARIWLPLQHAAQRVRHAWPHAGGHSVLWNLWPGMVSGNLCVERYPAANLRVLWGCKCKWARQRWNTTIDTLWQSKNTGREEMKGSGEEKTKERPVKGRSWVEEIEERILTKNADIQGK